MPNSNILHPEDVDRQRRDEIQRYNDRFYVARRLAQAWARERDDWSAADARRFWLERAMEAGNGK
jgi:hypothetical protein